MLSPESWNGAVKLINPVDVTSVPPAAASATFTGPCAKMGSGSEKHYSELHSHKERRDYLLGGHRGRLGTCHIHSWRGRSRRIRQRQTRIDPRGLCCGIFLESTDWYRGLWVAPKRSFLNKCCADEHKRKNKGHRLPISYTCTSFNRRFVEDSPPITTT